MTESVDWDDLMVSLGLKASVRPQTRGATTPEERAANTARCRKQRRRRAARGLSPDDPRHGKASTYANWCCRCPLCTAANTEACAPRVAASRSRKAVA
jgi:hypothetical protein